MCIRDRFSDMPDGEMGEAMQNAVDAGLIQGVSDTSIAPYDNITRAQMATIITRAFSAQENADQSFNDVASDAWYADAVSKAVSYTHLEKRGMKKGKKSLLDTYGTDLTARAALGEVDRVVSRDAAVSYTHLDGYKRQNQTGLF